MSLTVKFDGNKIGIDKQYEFVDTGKNVKMIAKLYKNILSMFVDDEADDDSKPEDLDPRVTQSVQMIDAIAKSICTILDLNATQKKRVINLEYSFSDEYNFFNDCLATFLQIKMPSIPDDESQDEDLEEASEDTDDTVEEDPK